MKKSHYIKDERIIYELAAPIKWVMSSDDIADLKVIDCEIFLN